MAFLLTHYHLYLNSALEITEFNLSFLQFQMIKMLEGNPLGSCAFFCDVDHQMIFLCKFEALPQTPMAS